MLQTVGWKSLTKTCKARDGHFGTLKTPLSYRFIDVRFCDAAKEVICMQIVKGQRGIRWWFNFIFFTSFLFAVLFVSVTILPELLVSPNEKMEVLKYIIVIKILTVFWLLIPQIYIQVTTSLEISKDGISINEGSKKKYYKFSEMKKVGSVKMANKYEHWQEITIDLFNNLESKQIKSRMFDNVTEIESSIVLQSLRENPNIEIDEYWIERYVPTPKTYSIASLLDSFNKSKLQ
jgi:hypothetical protein